MTPTYILTIDVGTTNLKVILFDANGKEVYLAKSHVQYMQNGDEFEIDMEYLWIALSTLLKDVVKNTGICPTLIGAMGITGQGEGCWLLDEQFQPVRSAILWLDKRATNELSLIPVDIQRAYRDITFSTLVPGSTIALLKWLDNHEPSVLDRATYCISCKDWIRFNLTDEVTTDFSDLSTSMITMQSGEVSDEVFALLGISHRRHLIPPVMYAKESGGTLSKKAALFTGLAEGTPIITGSLDIVANAIGCGAINEGDVSVTIGTTCSSQVILNELPVTFTKAGSVIYGAQENQYIHMVGSMAGTPNIDWIARELYGIDLRDEEVMTNLFASLDEKMKAVPIGAEGVVYHPYIMTGERAPFYHPHAIAQFFGINSKTTKEQLSRAVYEGIAFSIKDCLHSSGQKKRIIVSGGASKSDFLPQIIADCMGLEVVKLEGSEHTSKGAFIIAAVHAGLYDSFEVAIRKTTTIVASFQPNLESHRRYHELFGLYKNLQKTNVVNWEMRHRFLQGENSRTGEMV